MVNILIVDDELAIRTLLKDVLRNPSYRIDMCKNGKEALAQAERKEYDLIISDIIMPGMDGRAFMKRVRESGNMNADVPIISISGGAYCMDTNLALRAAKLYADDTIKKPFHPQKVRSAVHSVLSRRESAETKINRRAAI